MAWNPFTGAGTPLDALFGLGGSKGLFSDPAGAWDEFKNGKTNETNADIAAKNLEYQRERNAIEDERYAEETAYNRAFAEEERDYQRAFAEENRDYERALQQQIFDREDTALERQASSLSSMGINPLTQQLNGLGAGQAVSSPAPASAGAPASSGHGGTALHNDFQMQDKGILEAISPIMSLANGISNINTQGLQRDALREQNDYQRLLNQEKFLQNQFLENKLKDEEEARKEENRHNKANNPSIELDTKSSAERNQRENVFQNEYGVSDNTNTYVRMATDIANSGARATDYVADVSKPALEALANGAKDKINDFAEYLKNGWENDKRRFKNWYNKYFKGSAEKYSR